LRHFDELTTIGRARRLRVLAQTALGSYDLDIRRIRLINNMSNCTFRIDTTDARSFALRINLPGRRSVEEIRSELLWQEAVCLETDVAAPLPLRTSEGDLVVSAGASGVPERRLCNVSTWVRGGLFSRSKNADSFRCLGILMAKLHDHGQQYAPPSDFSIPKIDTVFSPELPDLVFGDDPADEIPGTSLKFMHAVQAALEIEFRRLYTSPAAQILHGDLHQWNVLVDRNTLHPIDFEDCCWGFPVQDIAITFNYVLRDERYEQYFEAFRSGYVQQRPWPEEYPGQVDLLLGQRAIELVNLLLNSPYREDRELIPEYIDIVDSTYRQHFERWRSLN
jgi:Ser/Thr protein kinase RdoA (MazF antagonist)